MKLNVAYAARTMAVLSVIALAASPANSAVCSATKLVADSLTSAPDLIRSNVPTCDGRFVSGFQIISSPIQWYADAHHAGECFNMDVTFLPPDVSAYDLDAVVEYLGDDVKVDVFRLKEVITCT